MIITKFSCWFMSSSHELWVEVVQHFAASTWLRQPAETSSCHPEGWWLGIECHNFAVTSHVYDKNLPKSNCVIRSNPRLGGDATSPQQLMAAMVDRIKHLESELHNKTPSPVATPALHRSDAKETLEAWNQKQTYDKFTVYIYLQTRSYKYIYMYSFVNWTWICSWYNVVYIYII